MYNVLAFILPILVFTYFGIVGYGAIIGLRSPKSRLQNILISPVIGISVTLLFVFWLNRGGLPVKSFAPILTVFLFLTSLFIVIVRKAIFPFKQLIPFILIFLVALWLTGRPLFSLGFNWISYANDDMANYCLGALRFLNHGYSDLPHLSDITQGKDLSQYYWFTFVPGMIRSGSELLLAWLSALTTLNPMQIFMPLILSFHLILISATGGLVLHSKKWRKVALAACFFLTCSALTTLGTLYELIAQVLGLALLITTSLLLFRLFYIRKKQDLIRQSLLCSIVFCALLIAYPEVAPLLALSCLLYFFIFLIKGWQPSQAFFLVVTCCSIMILFFLNKYWFNIIAFLQYQATTGLAENKGNLFPYFLIPSGLANLWGLQTVAMLPQEPWLSFSILLGLLLNVLFITLLIKQVPKHYPAAIIATVMAGLGFYLILRLKLHSGFSLFKLAMYIQPFLFAVLALGLYEKVPLLSAKLKWSFIIIILGANLYTQHTYLKYSYGELGTPFNELPSASLSHLPSELKNLHQKISPNTMIISDTNNIVSTKLQSLTFYDANTFFLSNSFFDKFIFLGSNLFQQIDPSSLEIANNLKYSLQNDEIKLPFYLDSFNTSYFVKNHFQLSQDSLLISDTSLRSIFNRYQSTETSSQNYWIKPIKQIQNHLIFVNSSLGQYYYFGENPYISLYNLEMDYYFPNSSMAGIGRYLLFQVIHPTKQTRLVMNLTTTLNHDGKNQLPAAEIIGERHYPLSFIGRGSARLFVNFSPRIIEDTPYFMLDLGKLGNHFFSTRKGLMQLYGNAIPLDTRQLIGFSRDISLISEDEYNQLKAPSILSRFPMDLKNTNLEYSGIYEDGWVAEDAFFILDQPKSNQLLTIKGEMPHLENNQLTLWIDNIKCATKKLSQGSFNLQVQVSQKKKHKIQLHFSQIKSLPKGDDRPAAAKIELIGFT